MAILNTSLWDWNEGLVSQHLPCMYEELIFIPQDLRKIAEFGGSHLPTQCGMGWQMVLRGSLAHQTSQLEESQASGRPSQKTKYTVKEQ